MTYIKVQIKLTSHNLVMALELITHILQDLGIGGLVIEDFETPDPELLTSSSIGGNTITAYLPDNDQTASLRSALEKQIHRLERKGFFSTSVSYRSVDEKNWSESWKSFFHPEKISPRLVVKPSWRTYEPHTGEIIIEIDPGMAFGTGTHPTTSLCLNLIEKYLIKGSSVLDIGTGSGILTIAAAKLGAGTITATDNDPAAVQIARDNLAKNHIDPGRYKLVTSDLLQDIKGIFQLVVANILTGTILGLMDQIPSVMGSKSVFIASGILAEDEIKVVEKMKQTGFQILETLARKEWVAVVGKSN